MSTDTSSKKTQRRYFRGIVRNLAGAFGEAGYGGHTFKRADLMARVGATSESSLRASFVKLEKLGLIEWHRTDSRAGVSWQDHNAMHDSPQTAPVTFSGFTNVEPGTMFVTVLDAETLLQISKDGLLP